MSPTPRYGVGDASDQAAGGIDGLRRLVDDFYQAMDEDPAAAELRRLHPEDLAQLLIIGLEHPATAAIARQIASTRFIARPLRRRSPASAAGPARSPVTMFHRRRQPSPPTP